MGYLLVLAHQHQYRVTRCCGHQEKLTTAVVVHLEAGGTSPSFRETLGWGDVNLLVMG